MANVNAVLKKNFGTILKPTTFVNTRIYIFRFSLMENAD